MAQQQKKQQAGPRRAGVFITVISDRNATAASAELVLPDSEDRIVVTGSTKRVSGDYYDEETAVNLAVGRALEKLAARLIHLGSARVNLAEQRKNKSRRKTERRPRTLVSLADIQEEHGLDAAQAAARQRGVEWPPKDSP